MRVLTILSGALLILAGLWCLLNQGVTFAALAFILGIAMVVNGIIGIFCFIKLKARHEEGNNWALADFILSLVLGAVVLSNQLATDLVIVMFFGMWLLFSGCNRVVAAFSQRKIKQKGWQWTAIMGGISVLAGIYCFFNPILAGLALGMLIGFSFLIQGINVLSFGVILPNEKK